MSKITDTVGSIIEANVVVPWEYRDRVAQVVAEIEAAAFAIGEGLLAKSEEAHYDVEAVRDILVDAGLLPEPQPEPEAEVIETSASTEDETVPAWARSLQDTVERLVRAAESRGISV